MDSMSQVLNTNVAKLMVIGVGGGGGNAVETMSKYGIKNISLVAMNTDVQALNTLSVKRMPIGTKLTQGLGSGGNPEVGKLAAEESQAEIQSLLAGTHLLFIAAGMGGGTGTGAAPIVAKIAQQMGILTIAVVTKPFKFEGPYRMRCADEGVQNLKQFVDSLVVVQNEQLCQDKDFTLKEAFLKADEILLQGIRGITDILLENGRINLDLADVKTVMKDSGMAHMGIGHATGPNRIIEAIRRAVYSPLLETTIQGAANIIINFRSSDELPLKDINMGIGLVRQVIAPDAKVFFGLCIDSKLADDVHVTLIATGFSGQLRNGTFFRNGTRTEPAAAPKQADVLNNPILSSEATVSQQQQSQQRQNPRQQRNAAINDKVAATAVPPSADINNNIDVPDKDVPPFLRKMKNP